MIQADADRLLGQTVGSYQLTQVIGTGGMGRVYLGVQPAIGSHVAVKVLSEESAKRPDLVERFFAEARAVNHIRHENIVNVLDLGQLPDGRPYIVMEHLQGGSLEEIVRGGGFVPLGTLSRVMEDILDALAAAHDKGVIHRDLKPDNIFVTPTGRAKVLDFGIAKMMPEYEPGGMEKATRTGQILGTPNYMAPEQITGGAVGPWTDLYALGVILYEAATGRVPFKADTPFGLLQKHVSEAPRPPRVLRPELPKALADVAMQALEKAPARRFQSASQMAVALEAAARSLPKEHWTALSLAIEGGALPAVMTSGSGAATEVATAPTMTAPQTPTPAPTVPDGLPTMPEVRRSVATEVEAGPRHQKSNKSKTKGSAGKLVAIVVLMAGIGIAGGYFALAAMDDGAEPRTENREPGTENREPTTDDREPTADDREPTADDREPTAEGGAPERFEQTPDFDTSKFDGIAYLPKAEKLAKRLMSDAFLVEFDVEGVYPNGLANLEYGEATYEFRSPSRSKRPADIPKNVEVEIECKVYVVVKKANVEVYPVTHETCDQNKRPTPRCSLQQLWNKAIAAGAESDNVVAEIDYLWDGWTIGVGEFYSSFPDDC